MTKPKLRIGLIGTGFMGKAHGFGFTLAPRVFELPFDLELHTVADITPEAAARAAQTLGFAHSTADWRSIMLTPEDPFEAPHRFRHMGLSHKAGADQADAKCRFGHVRNPC